MRSSPGENAADSLATLRAFLRPSLVDEVLGDSLMGSDQAQPVGDAGFADRIERVARQLGEIRPRGRPRETMQKAVEP